MRDAIALFYKGAMQQHKNNDGFTQRLTACIERVGGKRAMANAALISEAQLFRYVNAVTQVPSDRLVAIANAAQVDAGWLLTGEGSASGEKQHGRPTFRTELMVQVVQLFEELLIEFEKPFNPRQRARAITFLYNALRHEEIVRENMFTPQKFDMLKYLNFLGEMRTEEELEIMIQAMDILEYSKDKNAKIVQESELLRTWCNLLVRGMKGYYSSYAGQVYFERHAGGSLDSQAIIDLQNFVMEAIQTTGKNQLDWLDLGCGNGRHLMHLHKHMQNVSVKGIELSQLGYNLCKELMDSEKLPKDSVTLGDMRHLPYASETFDVVHANLSLHCLPYLPGSGLGFEEALNEAKRVLRKGGIISLVVPAGDWRDYSMPRQFLNEETLKKIAKDNGFKVINSVVKEGKSLPVGNSNSRVPTNMLLAYNRNLFCSLQKL
ncbi:MAG: class I SAM-dependent methyltransferase [Alphaproteobacteria bacterium]|nr:MAG: class I SAM-dependent methyltransferase [Alphaproteobacteria bacterium]